LARENDCTGRGRIALEGVNCTLTAPAHGARRFCQGLRDWDPDLFNDTDFKLTDGVPAETKFKALTLKNTQELVAYGLGGERAPLLKQNTAKHLEAVEYHTMLGDKDTVVIDVRNYYETCIGRIEPPSGGATFLDPQMRNSREFPKWLNAPETKEKLKGKKVMMYCTGGIRCERATALLSQMERAEDDLQTNGIYHVRGGIDRYLKTFPEGGYWKGRNYLFDLRGEQKPVRFFISRMGN
jgi:predicted sulfurtransferase